MNTEDRKLKLAYIAGTLDGDGSFSLIKKVESRKHSPLYFPMIQLANANRSLVDFLVSELGGSICTRKAHKSNEGFNRIASYQWKLEKNTKCLPVLKEICPYLVLKKERAEFLIDHIENDAPRVFGGKLVDPQVLNKREVNWLKMRNFNIKPELSTTNIKHPRQRKMSKDVLFWSYVAGLMDTDGSFSVKKETRKQDCINPVYSPSILLSMTDNKSVYHIINNCNVGKVFTVKAKTVHSGFCFRFGVYSKVDAIKFLMSCIPYLRVKKEVAKVLLTFCEGYIPFGGPRKTPQDQLDFREKCYQEVQNLNNGVYKSSLIVLKPSPDDAGGNKEQAGNDAVQLERSKREDADNKGDAVL